MSGFEGKFTRTQAENSDAFLSKMGANVLMRKAAKMSTPTMTITKQEGDRWKIVTSTILKAFEVNFELGKPFDTTTPDGRDVVCTIRQDSPDVWVTEQVAKKPKDKSVTMRRRFTPEGIEAELECDGVVSKEFYKRQ